MPASSSTPTTTSAGWSMPSADLGDARRHAHLLHHRRQRRLRRGDHERRVQRDGQLQRDGRPRDAGVHARARSTTSEVRSPTTTTRSGGRTRWTRRCQWTKQVASHWGGTRNGTIVHWPAGIDGGGEVRSQFPHVIDVAPTILEAAGLPGPAHGERGDSSRRWRATSMLYSFNERGEPGAATICSTSRCSQPGHLPPGLEAVTRHRIPWEMHGADACVRRRRLGALRRQQRLEPGQESCSRPARRSWPNSSGSC